MILAMMTLLLTASPTDLTNSPPVHRHEPFYSVVMSTSAPPALFLVSEDAETLEIPEGWRLEDVNVTWVQGVKYLAGLVREGEATSSQLLTGFDLAEFAGLVVDQADRGHCLLGFEAWKEESQERFAGVFAEGCAERIFEGGLDLVQFTRTLYSRAETHRLVDFETVVVDGRSTYSALWQPGESGSEFALLGVSWSTFHDLSHDLREEGYSLVDVDVEIEPWEDGLAAEELEMGLEGQNRHVPSALGRALLSGIWRPADGAEDWLGIRYLGSQLECAVSFLANGHGISGIHPKTGETLCDKEKGETTLPKQPIALLHVDGHASALFDCDRDHGGPLHDSGTAGPP